MSDQYLSSHSNSTNVLLKVLNRILGWLWFVAPTFTSNLILKLFFRPRSPKQRKEEKACWERGIPFSFKIQDRTLEGRYWGDGPGVLFVHGWNGRGSQFHRFVEATIASGHRAIAFDGPAHGESEGNYTTYFEFTDAVRALLCGGADMPIVKIVAHSFGAGAAINALHKENLELDVVLVAPALAFEEFLHESFQKLGFPFPLFRKLVISLEKRYGYNLHHDNPHRLLKQLQIPLLIIHDKGDKIVPYSITAQTVKNRQNIILQSTEGLGHTKILQEQKAIDSVLAHLFTEYPMVAISH